MRFAAALDLKTDAGVVLDDSDSVPSALLSLLLSLLETHSVAVSGTGTGAGTL